MFGKIPFEQHPKDPDLHNALHHIQTVDKQANLYGIDTDHYQQDNLDVFHSRTVGSEGDDILYISHKNKPREVLLVSVTGYTKEELSEIVANMKFVD